MATQSISALTPPSLPPISLESHAIFQAFCQDFPKCGFTPPLITEQEVQAMVRAVHKVTASPFLIKAKEHNLARSIFKHKERYWILVTHTKKGDPILARGGAKTVKLCVENTGILRVIKVVRHQKQSWLTPWVENGLRNVLLLKKSYIVPYYACLQTPSKIYIVEPYLKKDLQRTLIYSGLSSSEKERIMESILEVCCDLFESNALHRDLKLLNFFLNTDGSVMLGDMDSGVVKIPPQKTPDDDFFPNEGERFYPNPGNFLAAKPQQPPEIFQLTQESENLKKLHGSNREVLKKATGQIKQQLNAFLNQKAEMWAIGVMFYGLLTYEKIEGFKENLNNPQQSTEEESGFHSQEEIEQVLKRIKANPFGAKFYNLMEGLLHKEPDHRITIWEARRQLASALGKSAPSMPKEPSSCVIL